MTDPFDALASPIRPQPPRPSFARALRARLVEALDLRPATPAPQEPVALTHAARPGGAGERPEPARPLSRDGQPYVDGIWSVVTYRDVDAGIRFVTEVLGFEELVLVRADDGSIVHSEYRWPEGGIVQVAGVAEGNPFVNEPGAASLYVVTADPHAVWDRCRAAGVEVLREPYAPHYDPGGMGFSIRDPEGNAWSFGTYAGGATA